MPKPKDIAPIRIPIPVPTPGLANLFWLDVPDPGHAGAVESFVPVWGSGREALADYYDGHPYRALADAALAATDVIPVKAAAGVVEKGGLKIASKSWAYQRKLMGKAGLAAKNQPVHHVFIPQKGWGKAIPAEIKNMGWNLKPMESAIAHQKAHGYGLTYGPLQQFFHATPEGFQRTLGVLGGHVLMQETEPKDEMRD